jgi:hypothetical protein
MNVNFVDLVTSCSTLVEPLHSRAQYQLEQLAYTFLVNQAKLALITSTAFAKEARYA